MSRATASLRSLMGSASSSFKASSGLLGPGAEVGLLRAMPLHDVVKRSWEAPSSPWLGRRVVLADDSTPLPDKFSTRLSPLLVAALGVLVQEIVRR